MTCVHDKAHGGALAHVGVGEYSLPVPRATQFVFSFHDDLEVGGWKLLQLHALKFEHIAMLECRRCIALRQPHIRRWHLLQLLRCTLSSRALLLSSPSDLANLRSLGTMPIMWNMSVTSLSFTRLSRGEEEASEQETLTWNVEHGRLERKPQ